MPGKSMKGSAGRYPNRLDWLRYLCAFLLYMYGGSKLAHMQFSLPAEYSKRTLGSLSGYELTWYYYGYSYTYAVILGLLQVTGATLLLFRKTAFLGAALILPVIANILLIDIFILRNDYGPEVMAIVISGSMLALLWHGREEAVRLFWSEQEGEPAKGRRMHFWIRAFIVIAVVVFLSLGVYGRKKNKLQESHLVDRQMLPAQASRAR